MSKLILGCLECNPNATLADVDKLERSKGKRGIGWHILVMPTEIIQARPMDMPGNHTTGYNADSIGVGIVGGSSPVHKGRLGNYYLDGQTERALEFCQALSAKHNLEFFYQHQLIKTRSPYFGANL